MDTVNMLNTMRFYCQPILPLVYDESMSYYETLCKVVGQLNTTGDAVNKLNEGLTNEIADRQAADAALDERLKKVESANAKIHFLAFAGTPPYDAKPIYAMPTRSELRHWVTDGDMIVTLMQTTDEGRNIVYAASCAYNAPNWENASFDGFNIIVPISTDYDSEGNYAVRQKIAKITIPPASAASLDEKWGLQFIEINTPHTSAEGMVNFTATVVGETVTASITPAEFIKLFDTASATAKLCVGVNARLNYNALELSSSVATVYANSSAKREVRITFVQDPHAGRRGYVPSEIFELVNIVGDKDTNTWKVETFGTELFDFQRYEGFRFTRKAGDIIEAAEDCDPASVAQYYNDLPGKDYQNLPVHLIDEVDGAEYWNGIFDSYSDSRITFTFTTANYATIGDKMTVRVIELSATKAGSMWSGAEKWSYAAKEFDIPYRQTFYALDVWETSDTPAVINGIVTYAGGSNLDFDDLLPLVENNQRFVATLHKGISETAPEWSSLVYSSQSVKNGVGNITFAITTGINLENGIPVMDGTVVFSKDASGAKKVQIVFASALPAPSADGSDDGKVPTVVGDKWELESGSATTYVDFWPTADERYDAELGAYIADLASNSTYEAIFSLISGGKKVVARLYQEAEKTNLLGRSVNYAVTGNESLGTINFQFIRASSKFLGFDSIADYILLIKTSASTQMFATAGSFVLPAPNGDGSDNGKIPTVKGAKWELSNADKRVVVSCNVGGLVGCVDGYLAFSITCDHAAQEVVALLQDGVNVVATASLGDSNGIFIASSWEAGDVPSVVFTGAPGAFSENSVSPVTNIMLSSEKSYYRISAALPPLQPNVHNGRALVASDSGSTEYSTVRLEDKAVRFDADNSAIEVTNGNFRFVAPDDARATAENLRVDGTIVYDESQNLTEAQKQQARNNIGVNASGSVSTKVTLNGDIEGNVKGYTSATYQQITNEIANNCNIWLTISRETVRLASYKQSGASAYTLVFFGAGDGALTVKYEVTASVSSASLTVTGS